MKRKYILGGVLFALLMLVSTSFITCIPMVKGDDAKQGDLKPQQGQLLPWPPYGGYYRYEFRIKNIGGQTSPAPFYTGFLWDEEEELVSPYLHTENIVSDEVFIGYIYFYAPEKRWHSITVIADYDDDLVEEDETNNEHIKSYWFWWIG